MKIQIKKMGDGSIKIFGNLVSTQILSITQRGVFLCYSINREAGFTLDREGGDKIEVEK